MGQEKSQRGLESLRSTVDEQQRNFEKVLKALEEIKQKM
jgi:hypothetical protein